MDPPQNQQKCPKIVWGDRGPLFCYPNIGVGEVWGGGGFWDKIRKLIGHYEMQLMQLIKFNERKCVYFKLSINFQPTWSLKVYISVVPLFISSIIWKSSFKSYAKYSILKKKPERNVIQYLVKITYCL